MIYTDDMDSDNRCWCDETCGRLAGRRAGVVHVLLINQSSLAPRGARGNAAGNGGCGVRRRCFMDLASSDSGRDALGSRIVDIKRILSTSTTWQAGSFPRLPWERTASVHAIHRATKHLASEMTRDTDTDLCGRSCKHTYTNWTVLFVVALVS